MGIVHEVLVVTNDLAGRAEREVIADVLAALHASGPIEFAECRAVGDVDEVLDRRGGRPLVVAGGDGTLHAVLGRLWQRGEAGRTTVGLLPMGTGNDFARGVGIPIDPLAAAELITTGTPRPTDLVTDDAGGVVVNAMHVGAGVDAALRARPLKPYLRVAAFPAGALLAGIWAKGWRLRVEVDGLAVASGRRRVLMAGLANAPSIAGGTAVLAPGARVSDGLIDVIVSTSVGPWARAGYALGLMRGTHPRRDDVERLTGRTLAISGEPFYCNADGEITGPYRHRVWTVQPGAWHCIRP
jgi:diacylglycerol kinase (ATP)